ncbi:LIM domain [Popillia japonica]|uniref:LIM domain n=1 Tax=Popillia japonica TaxID=7064 RepID=A0AAW1M0V0_POPJA
MVICFTCNKRIEGQVLTALDKTYHPEHFVCEKCKKPICDNKFRTHDGRAYCEEDYNRMFVAQCFGCGQSISGKFISALGHDWHEEHFLCSWCNSKLIGQTFMEHMGKPICQKCFKDNVASKCKRCGQGITERVIKALDNTWHPDCFQCCKCKSAISAKVFSVSSDNEPICEKCS